MNVSHRRNVPLFRSTMVSLKFLALKNAGYASYLNLQDIPLSLRYARRDRPLSSIVVSDKADYDGDEENSSIVCKGHFIEGDTSTPLALKFNTDIERLKTEAKNYKSLRSLQGSVIPHCFGLLIGPKPNGPRKDQQAACLVLEDFGTWRDEYPDKLPRPEKGKILRLLDALHRHKHGASFFEFNSGNLLNKNGEYRLTDLSYLDTFKRHSTCVAGEDEDKGKDLAWIDTPFDTTESKIFSMCCYAMRVEAMKLRYWKRD